MKSVDDTANAVILKMLSELPYKQVPPFHLFFKIFYQNPQWPEYLTYRASPRLVIPWATIMDKRSFLMI